MSKPTKKQIKDYFSQMSEIEDTFWIKTAVLEERMVKETGMKDIMLFFVEGECVGIGNESKTMKLIERSVQ